MTLRLLEEPKLRLLAKKETYDYNKPVDLRNAFTLKGEPKKTPAKIMQPSPIGEAFKTYLQEAQPAFKYGLTGRLEAQQKPWEKLIKEEYPETFFGRIDEPVKKEKYFKLPWAKEAIPLKGTLREYPYGALGEFMDAFTKPSTYLAWYGAQKVIPLVLKKALEKLPPGVRAYLTKEIGKPKPTQNLNKLSNLDIHKELSIVARHPKNVKLNRAQLARQYLSPQKSGDYIRWTQSNPAELGQALIPGEAEGLAKSRDIGLPLIQLAKQFNIPVARLETAIKTGSYAGLPAQAVSAIKAIQPTPSKGGEIVAKQHGYEVKYIDKKPKDYYGKHFSDKKIIEVYTKGRTPEQIQDTVIHEVGHIVDYKRRGIIADPMGDSIMGFDKKLRAAMDSDIYFRREPFKTEAENIRKELPKTHSLATTQKEIWADAYKLYKQSPTKLKEVAPNIYKAIEDFDVPKATTRPISPLKPSITAPKAPEVVKEVVEPKEALKTPETAVSEEQKLLPKFGTEGEGFVVYRTPSEIRAIKQSPALKAQQEATRLAKIEEKRLAGLQKGVGKLGRFLEQPATPTQVTKAVRESTGLSRTEDRVVTNESKLLRLRLRAEQRVGKLAQAVGKREVRTVEAVKRRTNALVKSINSLSERNIPFEFKQQVQSIMDKFDLHFRQPKTLTRRQSMLEFVEGLKAQGELIPIPPEKLAQLDSTTLNDLNLDQLQEIKDTVAQIVHIGSLKGKLIASKEARDFTQVESNVVNQISQLGRVTPTVEEGFQPPSARKKGKVQQTVSNVDNYFANLRKVEFIARTLDNFKLGEVQKNITDPILQEAANSELLKQKETFTKLENIIKPIERNFARIVNDTKNAAGLKLTTQEMMGIYANSQNEGNFQRLTEGMNLTEGQISQIINALSPQEKKVVDNVLDLIGSNWNDTNKVTFKLIGKPLGKIEGKYFPIVTDKELSKITQLREAERDLFQDVFERSSVERGFTKARVGGGEPIDLNFFNVVMEHLNKVIHYNTHALPVRDTQKLLASPRIRGAITQTMGENILRQFQPWLKDVSNPQTQSLQSMEKWARYLRKNSTTAILGFNMSVSLLQGGSFTLTMKELGTVDALRGLMDFWKHPIQANNFVNSNSPQMLFRRKSFDREVQDWIKSKSVQKMIQNKRGAGDMLFSLITFVDRLTTSPTWLGAYNKKLRLTDNKQEAVAFADKTVRLTQPQGSARNLPQVARGTEFQKLFTQFYSHFTNVQNQMASAMDRLKLSPEHPLRKTRDWTMALLWILVAPALLGEWTRKGFGKLSPKEAVTGIVGYGAGGLFLIRDVVNAMIKPFGFKAPPAFRGLEQLALAGKELLRPTEGKEIRGGKLFERAFKATGALTGRLPSEQIWRSMTGLLDIMSGVSQDLRRLVFSKYALKEPKKEPTVTKGFQRQPFQRQEFKRQPYQRQELRLLR